MSRQIADIEADYLRRAGFEVLTAETGEQALAIAGAQALALIVLDLRLPGISGIDVARTLRRDSDVPIIMLTARVDESDRLLGLEVGADDYVTKPFSPRELVARVRAVLRRTVPRADSRPVAHRRSHARRPTHARGTRRRNTRPDADRVPPSRRDGAPSRTRVHSLAAARRCARRTGRVIRSGHRRPCQERAPEDRSGSIAAAIRAHCVRRGLQVRGLMNRPPRPLPVWWPEGRPWPPIDVAADRRPVPHVVAARGGLASAARFSSHLLRVSSGFPIRIAVLFAISSASDRRGPPCAGERVGEHVRVVWQPVWPVSATILVSSSPVCSCWRCAVSAAPRRHRGCRTSRRGWRLVGAARRAGAALASIAARAFNR